MSSPIPPVAVTFTAQGDDVVVRAAKRVHEQLGRTSGAAQRAGSQFSTFAQTVGDLGVALGVAKLASFAQNAVNTGASILKLSQMTGVSTESLSVLAFAGKTADISLEELGGTLKFLSKSLGGLSRGDSSTVAAFKGIGLSARDLKGLSLDQALVKIADAQRRFADGAGKAEAAMRIFGREGTAILPLLDDLADGGFDKAAESAKRMGLVWSRDAAKSAQDFNDSVTVLTGSAEGLAGQLAKEVTPGLTKAIQGTSSAIAELPDAAKSGVANLVAIEGGILGVAAAAQLLKRIGVAAALATPWGRAALIIGAVASVLLTFGRSAEDAKVKYQAFLDTLNDTKSVDAERENLNLQLEQNRLDLDATNSTFKRLGLLKQRQTIEERLAALASRRTAVAADGPAVVLPDQALIDARLAAQKAAIERQARLDLVENQRRDQVNKDQFDHGLQGYREYIDRRIALIQEGTAREVKALEAQRTMVAKRSVDGPVDAVKKADDVAKLSDEIKVKEADGQRRVADAIRERGQLELDLAAQRRAAEQQIQELQGQTFQAALIGIELEAQKFQDLANKLGSEMGTADDRSTAVNKLRDLLTLRAQAADVERQVESEFAAMDRDRQRIQALVTSDKMSEKAGAEEIARLERERLPTLQRLADEAMRLATAIGDPALVDQAKALGVELGTVAANADLAGQRAAQFRAAMEHAVADSLTGLLTDGIAQLGDVTTTIEPVLDKAGNIVKDRFGNTVEKVTEDVYDLGDAFVDTARRIVSAIQQIAAQSIANSIASAIFGGARAVLAGGGGTFGVDGGSSGIFHAATGGVVPGSGIGDTVPAMLTPGEFVINKRATAAHFGLLAEINQGIYPVRPVSNGRQHYASGGLVTTTTSRDGTITMELPEEFRGHVTTDSDFVRLTYRNRRAVRDAMGK